MQAKINLVKDWETGRQKPDRPARLRTILHIKLLVKDPLFCPGNDLIFPATKYGRKLSLCQDTLGAPVSSLVFHQVFLLEIRRKLIIIVYQTPVLEYYSAAKCM